MLFFALSNPIAALASQAIDFDAAMARGCFSLNWHYSFLYLPESKTQREQNTDYSSNQCLIRKNAELQPKLSSGRYKTKLVVPR